MKTLYNPTDTPIAIQHVHGYLEIPSKGEGVFSEEHLSFLVERYPFLENRGEVIRKAPTETVETRHEEKPKIRSPRKNK